MAFQNLILPIVSVFRSVGIQAARGALGGLNKDFETFAKQAGKAALAFAGVQALMASTRFISQSVEVTQQYERNMLALNQIFQQITPQMDAFNKAAVASGISQSQAAQASVFLGSVLKQYGLDVNRTGDETERLVLLAQDLATTYGYDLQEALLAITALFRGEYDPIEKFGVAMKQSEINAMLAAQGLDKLEGSASLLAQVQARLGLLYERSTDAQGAFSRATNTLYGSQQKLLASVQNLQIAFGTPLQEPLAAVNNGFAEIVERLGPQFVSIAENIGAAIELISPIVLTLGELIGNLIIFFANLIPVLTGVLGLVSELIMGFATLANEIVKIANASVDEVAGSFDRLNLALERTEGFKLEDSEILKFLFEKRYEKQPLIIEQIADGLADLIYLLSGEQEVNWFGEDETNEMKRFGLQAERTGMEAKEAVPELDAFGKEMKSLGLYSVDAEGKLTGIAAVFADIREAAEKSAATLELEKMGFNAQQIEYFLSKPDWQNIFGRIAHFAKLAALDISKASYAGAVGIMNAQASLNELLTSELGGAPAAPKDTKKPKDVIKDLFAQLKNETEKQAASLKLAGMGASEGLINLILGKDNWQKLWGQIQSGKISLEGLQKQFNRTADGVKEIKEITEGYLEVAEEYIEGLKEDAAEFEQTLKDVTKASQELSKSLAEVSRIDILPTQEVELGRFAQQIVTSFRAVRDELQRGLDAKSIYQSDYDALIAFVNQEEKLLAAAARNRDDFAERYRLSEALVNEYKAAFTAGMNLTSLFGQLKNETEKRTVTQVSSGIIALNDGLRKFNVTVTREYEETIDKVVSKSQGLLDGFRAMAEKARAFAENLRRLRDMGLNADLFDQLVQAGVEAGGETAQALVDGGSDSIREINGLFAEINEVGAKLGEEVATEYYNNGEVLAGGLLAGLKSKQNEFEQAARDLAEAFNREFKIRVDVAVAKPVAAAAADFAKATAAIPAPTVDMVSLGKIETLIQNATAFLGRTTSVFEQIRAEDVIDIYKGLRADITAGRDIDLSGIRSGMSVADLQAAAIAAGGTQVVNNYDVTVNANGVSGGVQAGQAFVEELKSFERNNGSVSTFLVSGLA
jgi:hypothetical protein